MQATIPMRNKRFRPSDRARRVAEMRDDEALEPGEFAYLLNPRTQVKLAKAARSSRKTITRDSDD
jgi:hypothetical protein